MLAECAAFYALRGLDPDRIAGATLLEQMFFVSAMRAEQERQLAVMGAGALDDIM